MFTDKRQTGLNGWAGNLAVRVSWETKGRDLPDLLRLRRGRNGGRGWETGTAWLFVCPLIEQLGICQRLSQYFNWFCTEQVEKKRLSSSPESSWGVGWYQGEALTLKGPYEGPLNAQWSTSIASNKTTDIIKGHPFKLLIPVLGYCSSKKNPSYIKHFLLIHTMLAHQYTPKTKNLTRVVFFVNCVVQIFLNKTKNYKKSIQRCTRAIVGKKRKSAKETQFQKLLKLISETF